MTNFEKADKHDHSLAEIAKYCCSGAGGAEFVTAMVKILKQAVDQNETYAFQNDELLAALFGLQPCGALDGAFAEGESEKIGLDLFEYAGRHSPNPADFIAPDSLVSWCERDPAKRYEIAATIVTFASKTGEAETVGWSDQAIEIFKRAPNQVLVLNTFIERFIPNSWGGSRAVIIENNLKLLDQLSAFSSGETLLVAAEKKLALTLTAAEEREFETKRNKSRNEKFE